MPPPTGFIDKPGSKYGPCARPCRHIDCVQMREFAKRRCSICDQEIGYERRYYIKGYWERMAHVECVEARRITLGNS